MKRRQKIKNNRYMIAALCISLLLSVLPLYAWASSEGADDGIVGTTSGETLGETTPATTPETEPVQETVPDATVSDYEACPECGGTETHAEGCPYGTVQPMATVVSVYHPTENGAINMNKIVGFPADGKLVSGVEYKLETNIVNCWPLHVPAGATVTIDLNGRMLEGNGVAAVIYVDTADETRDADGNIISASNPGTLNLINSNPNQSNGISGRISNGVWSRTGTGDAVSINACFITNHGSAMGIMVTGNLNLDGVDIIGCRTDNKNTGAAICGTSTATIVVKNSDIYYNRTDRTFNYNTVAGTFTTALGWGGVVHSEQDYSGSVSPSLTMINCNVYNNTSSSLGGGISGGYITLENCNVYNNTAYRGGGVCATKALNISGGSVHNNTATDVGGGIYTQGSCIRGVEIDGCSIYNNTTTGTRGAVIHTGYEVMGDGGGVYIGNLSQDHAITNCTIKDNVATYRGGGIFVSNGGSLLTVSGGTIHSNDAGNCGGGIYNAGNTVLTGGVTLTQNTAKVHGAGLYNTYLATLVNTTIQGNVAQGSGGGVYACYIEVPEDGNIQVLDNRANADAGGLGATRYFSLLGTCTITGNRAETGNGGGVYRYSQMYGHPNPITGKSIISGNYAGANGGGVYVGWHICTVSGGTEITGNTAGNAGGGVFIKGTNGSSTDGGDSGYDDPDARTTLIAENATISGNTAAIGGGIYTTNQGIINLKTGVTVGNNTANGNATNTGLGGGLYCGGSSQITINGATISGNSSTYENGGGIYFLGASLTISNATVSDNKTPDGSGAGLFVGGTYSATINNTKFTTNIAKGNGGGIYGGTGSNFTVTNSEFTGNSANNGGGIYQDRDNTSVATILSLDNTLFNGNTATRLGGGVYTEGVVTAVNGCEFGSTAGNTAGLTGGGIYGHTNAVITVTGGEIANNTATTGGGIGGVTGAQITVDGTQVTNNTASAGDGGGIYCQTDGKITVTNATITGNKSLGPDNQNGGRGGGIYCGPNTPISVTGTQVSGNQAYVQGGGIWIGTNVTATLNDVTVTGNQILTQDPGNDLGQNYHASGGGIYTNGTNLTVDGDSRITGNTARYWGGGIYAGNKVTLKGNTLVEGNIATNNGGGVYSTGTADLSGNVVFRNNSAHSGGGMYAAHVIITGTESTPILFDGNHALTGSGGGIAATQDANIQYVTVRNNDAHIYGGGIYCHMNDEVGATFNYSVANSTVSNNKVTSSESAGGGIFLQGTTTVTNCTVSGNTAIGSGGGIYVTGTATINGGEIKSNRTGVFGGGVCVATGASLNMSGTLVDGNDAIEMLENTPLDNDNTGRGGGICVIGTAEFTNVTLQNNRALRYGGGLHVCEGGNATWVSGTIQKNTSLYGGAGGIHAEDARLTIKDGLITENEADEVGGGIHVNNATLIIEKATITKNIVHAGGGGGIHANVGSKLEIQDGIVISENQAHTEQRITAITMVSNAPGAIAAVTRDGSVGTGNGGGLCVAGATVTMTGGTIADNTAEGNGGGVAVRDLYYGGQDYSARFDMISGSVINNTASGLGGGIYATGTNTDVTIGVEDCTGEGEKHTVTHPKLTHPVVTGNETTGGAGGGLAMENGATVTVYCGNITGNTAPNDGRGHNAYSAGDTLVIHDGATLGAQEDPEMVVVDGFLQRAAQAVTVKLHYYETNQDTTTNNTAQATAGEYFNLPDPSLLWSGNGVFLGWTFNGPANTASPYVRKPADYSMTPGTPLQAADDTDGHTDGEAAVHMYAMWAPQTSKITYTGCYIDDVFHSEPLVTVPGSTYNYNAAQALFTLPDVQTPGYTFQGWYLYQDEGQNANWGYEKSNMLRLNVGQQLDLGSGHFGDITLIPIYTENTVNISYHISVPEGADPSDFGFLTQGGGRIDSGYEEAVKVVTGEPVPVIATANHRYIFLGWYADDQLITTDKELSNSDLLKDANGQYLEKAYYARFDYYLDDLVITCNATGSFSDEQNFIYQVRDSGGNLITTVTLRSGESVRICDLYIGETYTVTQINTWSWRFEDTTAKSATVAVGGRTVEFAPAQLIDYWLTHDVVAILGRGV